MSGHSHWSTIKHKKEATDAKKGKEFSKVSKLLMAAAREGGADPVSNYKLQAAIDQARAVNMPRITSSAPSKRRGRRCGCPVGKHRL